MQKVYLLRLMPVGVSFIMLAAYFCQSPLKAENIFTTMNVKLLAVSALLVQSVALLVSNNCFINFFAIAQ
jgi:hypothetical protein